MSTYMKKLIQTSIKILRETKSRYKNPAIMWSTGKDSTASLALCRMSFFNTIPFPVIHLDTGYKFKQMYEYRDKLAKEWNMNLIVGQNTEALRMGMGPKQRFDCCHALKTVSLKQLIEKENFDAIIVSIRRDEHYVRNVEHVFSPRTKKGEWNLLREKTEEESKEGDAPFVSLREVELRGWELYQTHFGEDTSHVRVHPILHWDEIDIWHFIKEYNIPFNPMYLSKNEYRYRSLGCEPCTEPIRSEASTIDEIVKELETIDSPERAGRAQDKEKIMRKLRALGYM